MVVYLDTNAYIAANYRFAEGNFAALSKYLNDELVRLVYTSATVGEVERHIEEDVTGAIDKYNRMVRKELAMLAPIEHYHLEKRDAEEAVRMVKQRLAAFLSQRCVEQVALNPLDADELMSDYFLMRPPFEPKKPNEFKDAIMAKAIKRYQREAGERIYIVSSDAGFRRIFEGNENFVVVEFLGQFLRLAGESIAHTKRVGEFVAEMVDNGDFDDALAEYYGEFEIDRAEYSEWHCNEWDVRDVETQLMYIEHTDDGCQIHVSVSLDISAEIDHRDDEASYYDEEDQCYLVEKYVKWVEQHRVEMDAVISCIVTAGTGDELSVTDVKVIDRDKFHTIDLDEQTMQDWEDISTESREEPGLVYCSECGCLIGRYSEYEDYFGNAICGKCMVGNENGDICPSCGRKIPLELMQSDFCVDCDEERD